MSLKRLRERQLGFVNYFPANQPTYKEYEPFKDPYLEAYFQLPAIRHNLIEVGMLKRKKSRHKRSKATTEPVANLCLPPVQNKKKHSREYSAAKERIKLLRKRLQSLDP